MIKVDEMRLKTKASIESKYLKFEKEHSDLISKVELEIITAAENGMFSCTIRDLSDPEKDFFIKYLKKQGYEVEYLTNHINPPIDVSWRE